MNFETATGTGQTITEHISASPAGLIAQGANLLIVPLTIGAIVYVVSLLRRIANAQEASAKHLAEIAGKNK